MADFCVDNTQQVEFDEKVVCGLWQCEALRASQKELLAKRKDMPHYQKSKYNLRYLRQWPYIVLTGPEKSTIHPSISKEAIVENITGLSPLVSIPEI